MGDNVDERAIFVKGPVVIFKWRNEPGWPVEYASPNASEVFGYSDADFLCGRVAYGDLVVAEDIERVGQEVTAAIASDSATFVHEPYRVRHRDGTVRWLYDFTHVVRDADRATHFLGYVIDITSRITAEQEKRELEHRLLHTQKLESLGILAGGVAHDFNNLLTGIIGYASFARSRSAPSRETLLGNLDQIERLALRAADLTRQLLAYSGKGSFVLEPVDLGHVLDDLSGMLDVVLSRKATLKWRLAADLPGVMADRAQMQQVVMNLLTNASEALGDESGTITLGTSVLECSAEFLAEAFGANDLAPGRYVSLEVADTGSGMTKEVTERLFDPFFTTKLAGRGLGMSAVLGIVRGHTGAIRVQSEPGEGTKFQIILPASDRKAAVIGPSVARSQWRGEGTILIADDEPALRALVAQIVKTLGFATLEAADGKAALDLYRANASKVTLVLLDITMPVMSGGHALLELRKLNPTLPVVLTSGYREQDALVSIAAGGPTSFLQKPYALEDIERVLRAALETDGSREVSPG